MTAQNVSSCVQNMCTCINGTSATGIECVTNGSAWCSDCYSGLHLTESGTCEGTCFTAMNYDVCVIESNVSAGNICVCEHGKVAVGAQCKRHAAHTCTFCNAHYHLTQGQICAYGVHLHAY